MKYDKGADRTVEVEVLRPKYGGRSMEAEVWRPKYGGRSMEAEVFIHLTILFYGKTKEVRYSDLCKFFLVK